MHVSFTQQYWQLLNSSHAGISICPLQISVLKLGMSMGQGLSGSKGLHEHSHADRLMLFLAVLHVLKYMLKHAIKQCVICRHFGCLLNGSTSLRKYLILIRFYMLLCNSKLSHCMALMALRSAAVQYTHWHVANTLNAHF